MKTSLAVMAALGLDLSGGEVEQYMQADRGGHTAYVSTLGNPMVTDF